MINRPEQRRIRSRRLLVRLWLIFAAHALIFGLFVYFYPRLHQSQPDLLDTNTAQIAIPAWAGALALHLLVTALIDWRLLTGIARDERIRRRLESTASAAPSSTPDPV